ncbi:MAG TPA: helix-turn-helix domain-containing protein [Acidimicrobiales bacterium]|jgi:hypothetical protein|nr:helix-turn-helix domain-containing protein [Acidimicrobiales bacterium]
MSDPDTVVAFEAEAVEDVVPEAVGESVPPWPPESLDEWVTIAEAAKRLGLSPDRVRRRLKAGEFEARRVNSRYGLTWEIRLCDLPLRDSSSPEVVPTAAPRVVTGPRVAPTLAADGAADDDGPAAVELVRLVRHQQDQLTQLAGQVGFLQAQLQQAHETIKLLQAPSDETAGEGGLIGVEDRPQTMVMAEEVGHLKAELEQSRQRIAEFEAVAAELEREQAAAAAEAARRPWWRFW